jgi:hypothetical protein
MSLQLGPNFWVKWFIAQDWYALMHQVAIRKGASKFGQSYIDNLVMIYSKYIKNGEVPARSIISKILETMKEAQPSSAKENDLIATLGSLHRCFSGVPFTAFRVAINMNSCGSRSSPLFSQELISLESNYEFVRDFIKKKFTKSADIEIWLSRLEILNNFVPNLEGNSYFYANESRDLTRKRFESLPKFDALIYKWALELEGVNVESIFRDESNFDGLLEIDIENRIGIIPLPSKLDDATSVQLDASARVDNESILKSDTDLKSADAIKSESDVNFDDSDFDTEIKDTKVVKKSKSKKK